MQNHRLILFGFSAIAVATVIVAIAIRSTNVVQTLPYDERADARAQVESAVAASAAQKKLVLLIFGANWCEDCRALDAALKKGSAADLVSRRFTVVKIDVGNFDRNLDLTARYGNPTKKGIPAAVVLSPDGDVVYSTRAGELSSARHMGESGIARVLQDAISRSKN